MAYKGYIGTGIANSTQFFNAVIAFLVAVGWTLHDDIDSTHKVYKTQGESGTEPPVYVWVYNNTGSARVEIRAYTYWDAASHTGYRAAYQAHYPGSFNSAYNCIFAGDKDGYLFASRRENNGSASYWAGMFLPKRINTTLTTTTDAITAGSSVNIPVVSSAGFGVGTYCQILGKTEGCDKLQITAIPDGTHITVATLPRNYASGAYMGYPACVAVSQNFGSGNVYPLARFDDAGTTVGSNAMTIEPLGSATAADATAKGMLLPYTIWANGLCKMGYWAKNFLQLGYGSASDWGMANDDLSVPTVATATSGTSTTLVDSTKSWTPDALIGKWVVLVGGTGSGQARQITDNDATSITVDTWATNPDGTTEYKVCDNLWALTSYVMDPTIAAICLTNYGIPS